VDSDERFHGRELSFEQQDPSLENLERAGSREEPVEGFSMEQRNGTNFGSMRLTLSWISCNTCIEMLLVLAQQVPIPGSSTSTRLGFEIKSTAHQIAASSNHIVSEETIWHTLSGAPSSRSFCLSIRFGFRTIGF
jgi:hypothetical protein